MSQYSKLAKYYDLLGWAAFTDRLWPHLRTLFRSMGGPPPRFLDIACGTGVLAGMLSEVGVKVTGIDISPKMISIARSKTYKTRPKFSVADLRDFDLGIQFPMTGCFYDTLNHLLSEDDLSKAFRCAYRHTESDGHYLFDVNTVIGFRNWKPFFSSEPDHFYVIQHGKYDSKSCTGTYRIEAFVKGDDGRVEYLDETIPERAYSRKTIEHALAGAGFQQIVFLPFNSGESVARSERLLVICRK